MAEKLHQPEIGEWYKNEEGVSLEVIAVDEEEQVIEIQYFDGSIEELDFDTWRSSRFTRRKPPVDWSGTFPGLAWDDLEEPLHPTVWSGPLDVVDLETEWGD